MSSLCLLFFFLLLHVLFFYVCATSIEISSIPWALGGVLKLMNDNAVLKTCFFSFSFFLSNS
jgi:hypothetical protein